MGELDGLHPDLVSAMEKIYDAMKIVGWPMRPLEGLRTLQRQKTLYAQGRTTPGPIVTRNDGIKHPSNHQTGRAVDSVFSGPNPYLVREPEAEAVWAAFGALVEAVGLTWGGRFKMVDKPHVELPPDPPVEKRLDA